MATPKDDIGGSVSAALEVNSSFSRSSCRRNSQLLSPRRFSERQEEGTHEFTLAQIELALPQA